MASITKRENRWHVRIHQLGIACSFQKRTDAEVWARMMETGPLPDPSEIAFADLVAQFMHEEPTSAKGALQRLADSPLGQLTLAQIEPGKLDAFIQAEMDHDLDLMPLEHGRQVYMDLFKLFERARRKWGYPLRRNPLNVVQKPGPQALYTYCLDKTEVSTLENFADAEDPELAALIRLAAETALALGNLLAIKPADIDWQNGYLFGRIPLSMEAYDTLTHVVDDHHDQVFTLSMPQARRGVRRATAGNVSFRDLRATAIKRFFERGYSTQEIARITGYTDQRRLLNYKPNRFEHFYERIHSPSY